MNTHNNHRILPLLSAAVLALALTGAPATSARDAQNTGGPSLSAAQDKDADKLKSYSFAQRAEFTAAVRESAARLDTQIATLAPAQAGGAQADEARSKALDEVKSARSILDERISKVDQAIPANWESVRDEVLTALNQALSAYERAARL